MKKLALLLAMLLLVVPVLCSCGANSSPEKAVATAIDVMYGDGDADPEDFYNVVIDYNLDILENLDAAFDPQADNAEGDNNSGSSRADKVGSRKDQSGAR